MQAFFRLLSDKLTVFAHKKAREQAFMEQSHTDTGNKPSVLPLVIYDEPGEYGREKNHNIVDLEDNDELESLDHKRLYQGMDGVLSEVSNLRKMCEAKWQYDSEKTRLIDLLHEELQEHREGLHFKIVRPLLMDLVAMHSDMDKLIDDMQTRPSTDNHQNISNLRSFQESIEDLLSRYGVETFQCQEDNFNAGKQRIVKIINTDNATLEKKISRRVRKGFCYEDKILKPELVDTYKFVADASIAK